MFDEYAHRMSRFYQFNVKDDVISITPILTSASVLEEERTMHHLVYTMGFHKKPDALLLSARDKDGKRVETIEVNLQTYQVAQSRGVHNSKTEHHDRILALMEQGMEQIRKMKAQKFNVLAA